MRRAAILCRCRPSRRSKNADSLYTAAFHELSRWTGHKSRLDRDLTQRFGDRAYAAEELIAELSGAFLCAEFGFDKTIRHAAYVASWIGSLQHDDRPFFTAASKPQKPADYLRGLALKEPLPLDAVASHRRENFIHHFFLLRDASAP